jgi:S1-C subfamily serine protease
MQGMSFRSVRIWRRPLQPRARNGYLSLLANAVEGAPAARAGVLAGDVITDVEAKLIAEAVGGRYLFEFETGTRS